MLEIIIICALVPAAIVGVITWKIRPTVTAAVIGGLGLPALFILMALIGPHPVLLVLLLIVGLAMFSKKRDIVPPQ